MTEIDALQASLAAEHAACYAYGVLGGALAGLSPGSADQARADDVYAGHRSLRDELVGLITALPAEPVAAEAAYNLPFAVESTGAALRLARLIEVRTAAVHAYAVSQTADATRRLLAEAVSTAAVAGHAWGAAATPFPGAAEL